LAQGRAAGLVSGLGAATADAIYGCIAGFGLTFVSSFLVRQQVWIRLIGGMFLCYLGVKTLLAQPAGQAASAERKGLIAAFASTLLLTLANPISILSFAAVFAGLGPAGSVERYGTVGVMVLGIFLGSALWWLTLSTGVGVFRAKFDPHALQWINRISGVIITGFGLFVFQSAL